MTNTTNTNSKIYTAKPNISIPTVDDARHIYTIHLYQEGIIDSNDINIILDYNKDYPTRLFDRFELYYDNILIAINNYLNYMTDIADGSMFKINDIFPNYNFRIDTTNKPLEFKIHRNSIAAIPNNLKITYKILKQNENSTSAVESKLTYFKTTFCICEKCKKCGRYQTSVFLEHEPCHFNRFYIHGDLYDNSNYSNKPIKHLQGNFVSYILNDEKMENLNELHKGKNRFVLEPENKNINGPVFCIIHYNYYSEQ